MKDSKVNAVLTTIVWIFAITCLVIGFYYLVRNAIDHQEIAECHKWTTESTMYSGYYITQWQASQCQSHGIFFIDTPMR